MILMHPAWLWLLLTLVPLVALHYTPRAHLGALRATLVAVLRGLAFTALVLALARPMVDRPDPGRTQVIVADLSGSISDGALAQMETRVEQLAAGRRLGDRLQLVAFDACAGAIALPQGKSYRGLLADARRARPAAGTAESCLADALDMAAALIPNDGLGQVTLLSDGLQSKGDAAAAAMRLGRRHIGLRTVQVGAVPPPEVVLRAVSLPPSTGLGSSVQLVAEVESSGPTDVTLNVQPPEGPTVTSSARLQGGRQLLSLPVVASRQGLCRYLVRIESPADTVPANNRLAAAMLVRGPIEIRVLEDDPGRPATNALASMLGHAARVQAVDAASLGAITGPGAPDLLVVADTPANTVPAEAQQAVRDAVTGGMGLLFTGGRRSYGPGGWSGTPLAECLPVQVAQNLERRDPSTTLVVIIDTSGSMGGARVSLAKEIARLAIGRLKPHDKAGIVEFYGSRRWAAPIQPASNAIDLQRALNRLSASGGTIILPAIEEAYYALQNVQTRTKHVLVLTDGGVETGAFEPLIRRMADKGITVSSVLVGPEAHSAFLSSLAHWGRGRFYTAPDRFNLPEVIVKQPENSLLSPFIEQGSALSAGPDPLGAGVDFAAAPRVAGYVETTLRPTADLIAGSQLGHPVLARWRYGLGGAAAYTSQLGGAWSDDLNRWPPMVRIFDDLVRWLARPSAQDALRIEPIVRPAGLELAITNRRALAGACLAGLELKLTAADGGARSMVLDPVAPDTWNTLLTDLPRGTWAIEAVTTDGGLGGRAAVELNPGHEIAATAPDTLFLQQLERLAVQPTSALPAAAVPTSTHELWPTLAAAALALILLQVLVRRMPGRRSRALAATALLGIVLALAPRSAQAVVATRPMLPEQATAALQEALAADNPQVVRDRFEQARLAVAARDGSLEALLEALKDAAGRGPNGHELTAMAAEASGDLAAARESLTKAIAGRPRDARLHGQLARLQELIGDTKAAGASLGKALRLSKDPREQTALRVRLALLHYAAAQQEPAREQLRAVAAAVPELGDYAAHLAALNGDYELAVELLRPQGEGKSVFHDHLFRGLFLLRINRPQEAAAEFREAYVEAPLARDKRYALERLIAAARAAGKLPQLADEWLSDQSLSTDRLSALVAVLRELGRSQDALTLLNRPAHTAEQKAVMASADFQRELVATALGSGRGDRAEAAYAALLQQQPGQMEWRVSLARLKLVDGRRDEAAALFTEAIGRYDDPGTLMALADGARQLALDDAALTATHKAAKASLNARIRAGLFEADTLRMRGRGDEALALLNKLPAQAEQDPRLLQLVAEALERAGDKAESLRLFRDLYDRTKTEDILLVVAWLLEENGRNDEAYALWKEMWWTTQVPARLRQAQERMLALASQAGTLADLAIELEESLDVGRGGERELSLLIDIYTTANDPVSAAEILDDLGRRKGAGEVETLKRLARVYLNCEQFGRCNATLRRLAAIDPANASDYLQQIAIVAMERKQPQQAQTALAELAASGTDPEVVDEFAAGVMSMLGLHVEGAKAYERALARHPDRIETLLLWGNAMKQAEQVDQAVTRFQVLVEASAEDDLFTVAVDGLLNLEAKPAAIESALRRVYARIAANPEKVFLYQLAGDLLEALHRPRQMSDLLEQAVVVAGERRGPLLRELMDSAASEGLADRQIDFGRSLLALSDEVPPQVFLELGQAFIRRNDLAMAERVFERASMGSDFSAIQQQVAGYYENANLPADADRIIRQLLIGEPDNVALLIRSGALSEQLGSYERAFEQYYAAADLMLRRLPSVLRTSAAAPQASAPAGTEKAQARTSRATNIDELTQFFETAGNGLLNAARTPQLRQHLSTLLARRLEQELASLATDKAHAASLSRNPRLERLARFIRQVSFSLHQPDLADRMDRDLLGRYKSDEALPTLVVSARQEWGLYARAKAFEPAKPASVPATASAPAESASLADAAARMPGLIMAGQHDEARRLLSQVQPDAGDISEPATIMILGAIALDDAAAIERWATLCLDGSRLRASKGEPAYKVRSLVSLVWNELDQPRRAELVQRIERLAAGLDGTKRLGVETIYLQLAPAVGLPIADLPGLAERVTDSTLSYAIVGFLPRLPAESRPALLAQMLAAQAEDRRRGFILELAGGPLAGDAALAVELEAQFKAAPKGRIDGYSNLARSNWNRNTAHPALGRALAEILVTDWPEDPRVLTAAAVAREASGAHDEALSLAREAFEALLNVKQFDYDQKRMLDHLLATMRPDELAALADDLKERHEVEPPTPTGIFIRGLVLEAADRQAEALAAFRDAYAAAPANRTFSRKLIIGLQDSGRLVELARLLSTHLTKSTMMESFEWRTLAECWYALHNPLAAAQAAAKDETPLAPINAMRIARQLGWDEQARVVFMRFMTRNRDDGRFYTPFWPPETDAGGLIGFLQEQAVPNVKRPRLFEALADLPFARNEYLGLLTAARPGRNDIPGLVTGLVKAADGPGRQALIADLIAAHQADALNVKDRALIAGLAARDSAAVPPELLASLQQTIAHQDAETSEPLALLARVHLAIGQPEKARAIMHWVVTWDASGRTGTSVEQRFDRIDEYLAMLPPEQRGAAREKWLRRTRPAPLEDVSSLGQVAWMERAAAAGRNQDVEQYVAELRSRMTSGMLFTQVLDVQAALARRDAVAGRVEVFAQQARALLRPSRYRETLGSGVFDPRDMLPAAGTLKDPEPYLKAMLAAIDEARADGSLKRVAATRWSALIAAWCAESGLKARAGEILKRALAEAGDPGDHWLWVADVMRQAGDAAGAQALERKLLDAELLPVQRVPELLTALETAEGRPAADALAAKVAAYSDHPVVLERALRRAQSASDATAAAALQARQAALRPPTASQPTSAPTAR